MAKILRKYHKNLIKSSKKDHLSLEIGGLFGVKNIYSDFKSFSYLHSELWYPNHQQLRLRVY